MTDYRAHGWRTISHNEEVDFTVNAESHDQARLKAEDIIAKHPSMWKPERDGGSVSPLRWVISVEGVREDSHPDQRRYRRDPDRIAQPTSRSPGGPRVARHQRRLSHGYFDQRLRV